MDVTVRQNLELRGIIPAIVTPVDECGRFDVDAFERLVTRLYAACVNGLYVCGQTGEGLQQTPAQREQVPAAAIRVSPRGKSVIIHVGAASTDETIRLARHASEIGAHAISSLPPLGNYSFEEICSFYEALASASRVPLLIYYFPSLAPSVRTLDQILELCRIPNVAGLKFTDSDLFRLWTIRQTGLRAPCGVDRLAGARHMQSLFLSGCILPFGAKLTGRAAFGKTGRYEHRHSGSRSIESLSNPLENSFRIRSSRCFSFSGVRTVSRNSRPTVRSRRRQRE